MNTNLTINTTSLKNAGLDSTYFRTSDVTPVIDGDTLTIIDGRGTSRSWGSPSVRSDVSTLTDTVVMVQVTGWHKHTVSPVGGNYYFVNDGKGWTRRTANHKAVKSALAAKSH